MLLLNGTNTFTISLPEIKARHKLHKFLNWFMLNLYMVMDRKELKELLRSKVEAGRE